MLFRPRTFRADAEQSSARPPAWLTACAVALATGATGCTFINAYEDPALVGEWQTDPVPNTANRINKLEVDLDGEGKATLWYEVGGIELRDKFKLEWEQDDDREFELELRCSSSWEPLHVEDCKEYDFGMVCEVDKKGNDLDCSAGHHVYNTRIQWYRD